MRHAVKAADNIFVSYSRHDKAFARDLYEKLQELGFGLWRDLNEMLGGEDWWAQIQGAIHGAETMVLVMSPDALKSETVTKEWRYARQVGTRVIPVVGAEVNFVTVPRWMRKLNWLDFREKAPDADLVWDRFVNQLKTPYERIRMPFTVPDPPPILSSVRLSSVCS